MNNKNFAILYDKLFGNNLSDLEFYKYFIKKKNNALEIGSGTGRLLLEYLKDNLNVQGIEPNTQMLELCLKKAKQLHLDVSIVNQSLQELSVNKKFDLIYMPLFVFQEITQEVEIESALNNCYNLLNENGQLLITTFALNEEYYGLWQLNKSYVNEQELLLFSEAVFYNELNHIQTKYLKFETFINNNLTDTYCTKIEFKCYSPQEISLLLNKFGFNNIKVYGDYTFQNTDSDTQVYTYSAFKE